MGRNTAYPPEKGNVLFLILIAVALFAALSYVVSMSSRSGTGSTKKEAAALYAASLVQYASAIEGAIQRIGLVSSVPDWGYDLYAPITPSQANATCTSPACRVFDPNGGSVAFRNFDIETGWGGSGSNEKGQYFYSAAVKDIGTSAPELIFWQALIPKAVCQNINFNMGVMPGANDQPPSDEEGGMGSYAGTMASFPASTRVFGQTAVPAFAGKRDFCYAQSYWGHVYVHVLIAR